MNKKRLALEFNMDDINEASVYSCLTRLGYNKTYTVVQAMIKAGVVNPRITPIGDLTNTNPNSPGYVSDREIILSFDLYNMADKTIYELLSQQKDDGKELVKNAIIATHLKE